MKISLVAGVTASLVLGLAAAACKGSGVCERDCLESIAHKYFDALFKIRGGKISRVETVYINEPYHMPGVW